MSDLKPRGTSIVLNGEERHFLFTLNAIDELQDKYNDNLLDILQQATDEKDNYKTLRVIVMTLLNDEAEREKRIGGKEFKEVSEEDVGYMIGLDNFGDVLRAVLEAYGISMPEADEDSESPNPTSEQKE